MPSRKILFVDDDANLLAGFERNLRKVFTFDTSTSGADALTRIARSGPYAVIVADMQMPQMNGIELLGLVRTQSPDTVRIMLTGNADQKTAVDAVNKGSIFAFLNKPCEQENLRFTIEAALKQYELVTIERELLEGTVAGCVKVLSEVLAMVDPNAFGRGQKLRDSIKVFAQSLGLSSIWHLEVGAMLADIGLVSVPPLLLRKFEGDIEMTTRERDIAEKAPQIGHDLVAHIPRMEEVAAIILYQNKNFDGSGYPEDGVKGEAIPLGARMLKILRDRETLESDGIVKQKAYEAMKGKARIYDPALLDKCFGCMSDFLVNSIQAERPVHSLGIHELLPGQVLVSDIKTMSDVLLVAAGNRLTEVMIRRLNNYADYDRIRMPVLVQ